MKRADCIKALCPELEDRLGGTIMGACAQELYDLGHRENFFYLEHAMGLASSIGLGLAMNLPDENVVVMDGDGSVLMNLGGLATLARYRPPNLTHLIFDNGSLLSTGGVFSHHPSRVPPPGPPPPGAARAVPTSRSSPASTTSWPPPPKPSRTKSCPRSSPKSKPSARTTMAWT